MGLFYVFYSVCFYYCHILAGNISGCRSYCSSSLCLHLPDYSWGTSIFAYDNDFDCNGFIFAANRFWVPLLLLVLCLHVGIVKSSSQKADVAIGMRVCLFVCHYYYYI